MDDIFETTTSFEALGLDKRILRGIEALGWEQPTHVQARLVPVALSGRDILGQSKTGTGKTAAFGMPMVHHLLEAKTPFSGLALAPTRELAIQVAHDLRNLARFTEMVDAWILESRWAVTGDPCVLVAGGPIGMPGVTNSLALHTVGDPTTGFG